MTWWPPKALGLFVGLVIILTIAAVDAYLIHTMLGQPFGLSLYFTALLLLASLPLLGLCLYWYVGLITLRYQLDRNALVITSVGYRYTIPMQAIREVRHGADATVHRGFRGVGWPGYLKGSMRLDGLGETLIHSTRPVHQQLIIITDSGVHGISPTKLTAFEQDLARRQALGPMHSVEAEAARLDLAGLPVWRDRLFLGGLLLLALVDLGQFGAMAARFQTLPLSIPLHVIGTGEVMRIASRTSLLLIPALGSFVTLINGLVGAIVHARERVGAYLLLAAAVLVHVVTLLALGGVLG